jgi:hypothetical protein
MRALVKSLLVLAAEDVTGRTTFFMMRKEEF